MNHLKSEGHDFSSCKTKVPGPGGRVRLLIRKLELREAISFRINSLHMLYTEERISYLEASIQSRKEGYKNSTVQSKLKACLTRSQSTQGISHLCYLKDEGSLSFYRR